MYRNKIKICFLVLREGGGATGIFALCKFMDGVLMPFTAYAFQRLVDGVIYSFQIKNIQHTCLFSFLMVVGIYIFQAVKEPVEGYCNFLMRQRLGCYFQKKNMSKLAKMEYFHLENYEYIDLIERVCESTEDAAVDFYINSLELISCMVAIIGTFFLLLSYNVMIAICTVMIAIPIMVLSLKYGKEIYDWYERNGKNRRRVHYLSSIFTQKDIALEMRIYNHFEYLYEKWKDNSKYLRMQDFKLQIKAWRNTVLSGFLFNFFEYGVYMVILIPAIGGRLTIGAFIGLSKAIGSVENLILWKLSGIFSFFSNSVAYWNDYHMVMTLSESKSRENGIFARRDVGNTKETISPIEVTADISVEFRDVHFRYENMETEILRGVSFIIRPKEMVGLVGINGAGKSTLLKLLVGLYMPDSGDIFINGRNTRDMDFDEQSGYFGVTYQDFERYHLSVLENIGLPAQNIDIYKVKEILSFLDFDYAKLTKGVSTMAGHLFGDGTEFSCGEWQKISLARMLYSEAPFYIMDEPTASLDPMSEVALYRQMKSVLSDKSSLLITHRLGATVLCDKILVLAEGKIVESGTFSELMQRRGVYAEMYQEQKWWYAK